MRLHGVANFPDPDSSGQLPKRTPQQLGVSSSQFEAAETACRHLLPNGPLPPGGEPTQAELRKMERNALPRGAELARLHRPRRDTHFRSARHQHCPEFAADRGKADGMQVDAAPVLLVAHVRGIGIWVIGADASRLSHERWGRAARPGRLRSPCCRPSSQARWPPPPHPVRATVPANGTAPGRSVQADIDATGNQP
jgi:hypothetical protein